MDDALNPLTVTEAHGGILSFAPGRVIGDRYELRRLLGRGGMGEVWLAFDMRLRVETALKALRRDAFSEARAAELLHREIRAARRVISPHVCRIFDLVVTEGLELLSMEYVDGMTLREILATRSPLELREAKEIASQFLAGLSAIHAAGLVHRDFKPANVMVTRAGRVVVMDLGLAREVSVGSGSVAGTPAYMPPEQARGEKVDARADLFAAGVVLAEMVAPSGVRKDDSLEGVWRSLRRQPPQIEESAWASVIRRALESDPERRYESAHALARALEQISLRSEQPEDAAPYPGLASYREADSKFFFGREMEVEALWRNLAGVPRLFALAGPSGAGKTSLLRAGIMAAKPESWRAVICTPGERPFVSLARALAPDLARDARAVADLILFDDPEVAVTLTASWRRRHAGAFVIVDQFEELFTLATADTRAAFAELLGRLPVEANVHVLLSIRDDFLLRCHDYPALAPVFSDLAPCAAPAGDALRRAIVRPAFKAGYQFEDEEMADELLAAVSGERAALPLVAFTMASLWERRDRENGVLTRAAYEEIGGVSGSLAQHAEAVLQRIGPDGETIVRELFRNLVTAHGTRIARDRDEILSVFEPERRARVVAVVDALVTARLLTAYDEDSIVTADGTRRRRVEIVHESLLASWPRLVRWRTQDADGAQFRDHLRQSAQVWNERGRPEDLLWSGDAYRELALWRSRYPGALSADEACFAGAAESRAKRQKRTKQLAFAAVLLGVLAVAVTTSLLWRRAERERTRATAQSTRAEAQQLIAMARAELGRSRTVALAYATKSLELQDADSTRKFVMEILWSGPVARMLELTGGGSRSIDVTPDGSRLVFVTESGSDFLVPLDGGTPEKFELPAAAGYIRISSDGRFLVHHGPRSDTVFSLPDARPIMRFPGLIRPVDSGWLGSGRSDSDPGHWVVRSWPFTGGAGKALGRFRFAPRVRGGADDAWEVHPSGRWAAVLANDTVRSEPVDHEPGRSEVLWKSSSDLRDVAFDPSGDHLFAIGVGGLEVWSPGPRRTRKLPFTALQEKMVAASPRADRGRVIALGSQSFLFESRSRGLAPAGWFWDLADPAGTEAILIDGDTALDAALDPEGRWIATVSNEAVSLWPIGQYVRTIRKPKSDYPVHIRFAPDGRGLITCAEPESGARIWSLDPGVESRDLRSAATQMSQMSQWSQCIDVEIDSSGRRAIVIDVDVFLHDLKSGIATRLVERPAGNGSAMDAAFDPAGKRAVVYVAGKSSWLDIVDLQTGGKITLPVFPEGKPYFEVDDLTFGADGHLYAGGHHGLKRWTLPDGTRENVIGRPGDIAMVSGSANGRYLLVAVGRSNEPYVTDAALWLLDLMAGTRRRITTHGGVFRSIAINASGSAIATTDPDGAIRVGPVSGALPRLLLGGQSAYTTVAISPDGRWLATETFEEVRLWPMPDLSKPPLHTLPHDQLVARLRDLTNLRAIPDPAAEAGYRLEVGPFSGAASWSSW